MSTTNDELAEIIKKAEEGINRSMKLLGQPRRERFEAACAAMQGLLANKDDGPVVKQAVIFADALLLELERTEPKP